jgi:hypothetical protein
MHEREILMNRFYVPPWRTTATPVRAEPVEASAHGMRVFPLILSLSKDGLAMHEPFDRLRANGSYF